MNGIESTAAEIMADAILRLLDGYVQIAGVNAVDTLQKIKKEVLVMKRLASNGQIAEIIKAHRR